MKRIIILSAAATILYAISQVCGCGDSCSVNAQTMASTEITKGESKTVTLKVTGMTCAGCANNISASLDKLDGVLDHEVKFPGDVATIKYDPDKTSAKEIIAAIKKTGKYKVKITTDGNKTELKGEKKKCGPGCTKACCAKN